MHAIAGFGSNLILALRKFLFIFMSVLNYLVYKSDQLVMWTQFVKFFMFFFSFIHFIHLFTFH